MNIRKLRLAKGLTQAQLAEMIGVSIRQIGNWESNGLPNIYDRLKYLEKILWGK